MIDINWEGNRFVSVNGVANKYNDEIKGMDILISNVTMLDNGLVKLGLKRHSIDIEFREYELKVSVYPHSMEQYVIVHANRSEMFNNECRYERQSDVDGNLAYNIVCEVKNFIKKSLIKQG